MLKPAFLYWIIMVQAVRRTESNTGESIAKVEIKLTDSEAENIPQKSNVTLMCSVNIKGTQGQSPNILYSFYKGERDYLLVNITSDKEQSNYIIVSAKASHTGYYMCAVRIGDETKKSKTLFISVPGNLQTPVLRINSTRLAVGASTELTCEAPQEFPPLTFIFYENGSRIGEKDSKDNRFAVYTLSDVTAVGATNYSCTVQGVVSHSQLPKSECVQITVHDPVSNPVLEPSPNTLEVWVGQNVALYCNLSSGTPPINFTLFLRAKSISTITSNTQFAVFHVPINVPKRSGEYKCKADNGFPMSGTYSNGLNLTGTVPVSNPVLEPVTDSSGARLGQNVALNCNLSRGTPPINFTLFLRAKSISTITSTTRLAVFYVPINDSEHSGEYKCKADNGFPKLGTYSNGLNLTVSGIQDNGSKNSVLQDVIIIIIVVIITIFIIIFIIIFRYHNKNKAPEDVHFTQNTAIPDETQSVYYASIVIKKVKENDCEGHYCNIGLANKVRPRRDTEVIYSEITKPGASASADGDTSSSDEDNSVQYIQLDMEALCREPAQKQ